MCWRQIDIIMDAKEREKYSVGWLILRGTGNSGIIHSGSALDLNFEE